MQSLVHASAAGGAAGKGPGGQDGPGATGSGGVTGAGSRASALGTGAGPGVDQDPRDRRRMLYLRQVVAKITNRCIDAVPKSAIADGRQGTVFVSFTIQSDGSVAGVRVARPSGIPELDESCRAAVATKTRRTRLHWPRTAAALPDRRTARSPELVACPCSRRRNASRGTSQD